MGRYYKKKEYKTKNGNSGSPMAELQHKEFHAETPDAPRMGKESELLQFKAFKDLQQLGSIEVKADPNSSIQRSSQPYPILNRTNKVVDAKYPGSANIEGNVLTRLQNSTTSKLLNLFDVVTLNFRINYLYLCYSTNDQTNHNNLAVNLEMLKAIEEAVSFGYSTMFTQLPYYTDVIETNMPVPGNLTESRLALYGKMGGLLHYQTVLQNLVAPLSKYIETMSLQDTAKDMTYRREASLLISLFGLLNKSAFKSTLNAIGTSLIGEYFDSNWYKQMNTLAYTPSRKSNDMFNPLLTATMTTAIPATTFKTINGTEYYNSDDDLKTPVIELVNPDTWRIDERAFSLEELIYRVVRLLDISTILSWARKLNAHPTTVNTINTPSAYYQQINKAIEQVKLIATRFSTAMTDVRTFIDKLASSNMVYWRKGLFIDVNHINQFSPNYNVILHNMMSAYLGGSGEMIYDNNTQRWQAYTMWNKYTGIAEFDRLSGGSFLTFGLRNLNLGDLTSTDSAMCLPVVFADTLVADNKCIATTRTGINCYINNRIDSSVAPDPVFGRLDPLDIGFKVKIPTININEVDVVESLDETTKIKLLPSAILLLNTLIGYGEVSIGSTNVHKTLDHDYICFLDIQIEDVTNDMITFCRNYSPFRVSTPSGKRTIGFGA